MKQDKVRVQPYHKYVFDIRKRRFIGKFEEMYRNEDKENYDSWFQDDMMHFGKQVSALVLNRYDFKSILDIGCGKGAFTNSLKKAHNEVSGVDVSRTAINKAKTKYKNIVFFQSTAGKVLTADRKYDLIVMMEIMSYIKNWKSMLKKAAKKTSYLYVSLYLPPDPIGFVKSFRELKGEMKKYFSINFELLWNNEVIFLLGKRKKGAWRQIN